MRDEWAVNRWQEPLLAFQYLLDRHPGTPAQIKTVLALIDVLRDQGFDWTALVESNQSHPFRTATANPSVRRSHHATTDCTEDVNLLGGDLEPPRPVPVGADWPWCSALCNATAGCAAFVFESCHRNASRPGNHCYLKRGGWITKRGDQNSMCTLYSAVLRNPGPGPPPPTPPVIRSWFPTNKADADQICRNRWMPDADGQSGPNRSRLAVAHFAAYDRARVLEQYRLYGSPVRVLDTMSLHIATSGLSSQQTFLWHKARKAWESGTGPKEMEWANNSSPPSLKECYGLWCSGELSKEDRDTFVEGEMIDIATDFDVLMRYCASDCAATFYVFKKLLPTFLDACPHPVTFAGMLEMATAYLPVDESWVDYCQRAQMAYDDRMYEDSEILPHLAQQLSYRARDREFWEPDLWLTHLDWELPTEKYAGPRWTKDGDLVQGTAGSVVLVCPQHELEKPKWCRELLEEYDWPGIDMLSDYAPSVTDNMTRQWPVLETLRATKQQPEPSVGFAHHAIGRRVQSASSYS